jgi:hypothetical protein
MRRIAFLAAVLALAAGAFAAPAAVAGSPHFIQSAFSVTRTANTLTVSGKEAGLGDEAQVHIVVTATAECINGGGNHPKAVNKTDVSAAGDFPVQNGKADFSLTDDGPLHECDRHGHDQQHLEELGNALETGLGPAASHRS